MAERPSVHVLVFGESGSGKSTFAATFPKPMLVFAFDPYGKDTPYLRAGVPEPLIEAAPGAMTPHRIVRSKKGELKIQLEYFLDADPQKPTAYERFMLRLNAFRESREHEQWATLVVDSVTFMELAARKWSQYVLNATTKEPRQWYAFSTDALEESLMLRFGAIPSNVVVVAHIDKDKDEVHGSFVRNPAAPGRLRERLASAFGEFYRAYVDRGDDGAVQHWLQTRGSQMFPAASQIGAPNPCPPHYEALWVPASPAPKEAA